MNLVAVMIVSMKMSSSFVRRIIENLSKIVLYVKNIVKDIL